MFNSWELMLKKKNLWNLWRKLFRLKTIISSESKNINQRKHRPDAP